MINEIVVRHENGRVMLKAGDVHCPAAIGKNGMVAAEDKREGDLKTPIGVWPLRCLYFRADKITLADCSLKMIPITKDMGWCDAAEHDDYNKEVALPFDASHEKMWRDDHAYDLVIPMGYNDENPMSGKGSAIFFHLLHDGKDHTAGCVAIAREDMLAILPHITTQTVVRIEG